MENESSYKPPRIKATYKGEVLGWYDTAEEGEQAIEAARKAEADEDQAFLRSRP